MARLTAWLARWGWLGLALASPFFLFPAPGRTPLLLMAPLALAGLLWRPGRKRSAFDGPVLLLAGMLLVSEYATFDLAFSLPKIAGLLLGVGALYATLQAAGGSRLGLERALGFYLLLGLGLVGLGLLNVSWMAKFSFLAPLLARLPERLLSLPGLDSINPNELAGALLWLAPLTLALSAQSVRARPLGWRGLALIALSVFFVGALLLTQSRGAWAGLLLAVLVMAAAARPRLELTQVGLGLAAAGLVAFAALAWSGGQGPAVAASDASQGEQIASTLDGRLEIWSRALYGIQDFPLTGMGMNTFRRVMPVLYPLFLIGPEVDLAHAHNQWLQAALDLGLPGLVGYLALWFTALAMLWRVVRRGRDPFGRAAGLGLLGCLAGYFVYGLTDTVALGAKPGFLLWMLFGLAGGLAALVEGEAG